MKLAQNESKLKTNGGKVTKELLQDALDGYAGEGKTLVEGTDTFTITFLDTQNKYIINENGKVITTPSENIFTYTNDGYITGVKSQYIISGEDMAYVKENGKYASLNGIKVAVEVWPECRFLREEVGTSLIIPEQIEGISIKGIAEGAFYAIGNLEGITLPATIEIIEDSAFEWCTELSSINFPEGLTKIGAKAFYRAAFTTLEFPSTLTEIGASCFENADNVTDKVFIPINVTVIGERAFYFGNRTTVYCEAESKPNGWDENWNGKWANPIWGATR